jgi:hypothetical protein
MSSFDSIIVETYQNLPYYLNIIDNIIKSQFFQAENKQIGFLFVGTGGVGSRIYGTEQLLDFFITGVLGFPVSIYADPIDQQIYTIWLARDFFQNLLDAAGYSISYHNEGKLFSYLVTLPAFYYPSSAQRKQLYNGDTLSILWYTAVLTQ